jgi:hypothetical protein
MITCYVHHDRRKKQVGPKRLFNTRMPSPGLSYDRLSFGCSHVCVYVRIP